VLLSKRGYPLMEIAERFQVSTKTIRRDLRALEDIGVPVFIDTDEERDGRLLRLWRIDRYWIQQFM
jgi:predicted DNA-binding transcriptional regulator YafY